MGLINTPMKTKNTESIYALFAEPYDDIPVYVGRTKGTLKARLSKHLSESKKGSSKKCRGIRQLLDEGFDIGIMLLQTVDVSTPSSAEDLWITNIQGRGIELLNSQAGDSDRHQFIPDPDYVSVPWSVDLLNELEWSKDYIACGKGEWGATTKGVSFYRKGFSKLRFVHAAMGKVDVAGYVWERKLEKVVELLT